ncbi:hypothetical protein EMIHUDRAFT_195717 [Emiliania huxleyi CCMP1516]|uniref:Phosphatidylinositol-3,4,5-trisphosphate 3-phosphatase n=2 Tax=Emiliania huxleyi TaxID=2903 RepID=A0A0D3JHY7_EMIH1|nr:hypothetical protein EMIHUDRAFT_195717 [Emiliania huxleyi CCMP1516]EOD23122.1 hypothetical protein EMIHUDRAFT_195717 [Emiliania huxleyi CCMP1516]|eukprot:XP_005775551.1 hypothetical protein EMIHUDRAFT_195717 [Emiliania huxleyi CCMP1516]
MSESTLPDGAEEESAAEAEGAEESEPAEAAPSPDIRPVRAVPAGRLRQWLGELSPAEVDEGSPTLAVLSSLARAGYEGTIALAGAQAAQPPLRRLRGLVSGSKQRFRRDGFDLDLTYVTPTLLALGLPASGLLEPLYRNPLSEVRTFLERFHGRGGFTLVNLCNERDYLDADFPSAAAVLRYPSEDHHAPPLQQILAFCVAIDQALRIIGHSNGGMGAGAESDAPVVAVHCKAGKGRTGVMLAAYLVWSRHEGCEDAGAALSFFRRVRTSDGDAVVNPSQVRYVHHFASLAATPEVERPRLLQGAPVTLLAVGLSRVSPPVVCAPDDGEVLLALPAGGVHACGEAEVDLVDVSPRFAEDFVLWLYYLEEEGQGGE